MITDSGTEFIYSTVKDYCEKNGLIIMPYTSEQNGIAERKNRTLKEFARSILMDSGLGIEYSMDAMVFATFIRNRSPRKKPGKTAIDLITGKRPSFKYIHAFGTTCYVTIAKEERRRKGLKTLDPFLLNPNTQIFLTNVISNNVRK